jgi:glycosyltransferase involved in cell wall biosynthesis
MKKPSIIHPKISLITPSLNQGQYIKQTIHSVLSQDYLNIEYIVVDGCSTDNTIDVLKNFSGKIRWVSEKDNGQTDAINKGLRMASGDIVGYLNADDLLLPGTLSRVAQLFTENPEAMWVTGQCRIIDEDGGEIRRLITAYKNVWLRFHSRSSLIVTDYISQPSTFWRASVISDLGYLDETLHYAMDYEYWLRLYAKYPLVFIPEYLAAFRIHTQSKNTNAGHKDVYINEEKKIIKKYTGSFFLQALHDLHRWLMTTAYSIMSKRM